jgi:hypothetical protein
MAVSESDVGEVFLYREAANVKLPFTVAEKCV